MTLICKNDCCKYWNEDGGVFIDEGGCTRENVSIDMTQTSAGFYPICTDYEEKE